VGQQHERQEPGHLVVGGQPLVQPAGETDRLLRQVRVGQPGPDRCRVPLREDQVEHVGHSGDPAGQLVGGRDREPRPGLAQAGLGPTDPLGHGRLGHQERSRDLPGGEPADRPERQRHLRQPWERRVAAKDQQRQRVVALTRITGVGRGGDQRVGRGAGRDPTLPLRASPIGAPPVDQPPRGHGDQPPLRVVWHALGRPLPGRGEQRLLHRVLGRVEIAVPADQRGEGVWRTRAPHVLEPSRRH
jgi:hypothetical protein